MPTNLNEWGILLCMLIFIGMGVWSTYTPGGKVFPEIDEQKS